MDFSIEFEHEILSKATKSVTFLQKAVRICDAHHLSTPQLEWIWKQIKDVWLSYKEICNSTALLARAERDFPDATKRFPYELAIKKIDELNPKSPLVALDELKIYVRESNLQSALEETIRVLEKNKIDDGYNVIKSLIKKDVDKKTFTNVKWIEEFEKRQEERRLRREHPELYPSITTGIPTLDNILTGIQIGQLGLILGTTGRGKSILLANFAYHALISGVCVVYISLEMPARQISMRMDSLWLDIEYDKLKKYNFTAEELEIINIRLEEAKKLWKDKFRIISLPVKSSNMDDVKDALEDIFLEDGFKPTLLLFDSLDHMKAVGRSEGYRLDQTNIYWSAKNLAEDDGYAIWTTTQAGKEYVDKLATAESAAEAYDKGRIADIMISLNEPSVQITNETYAGDSDDDFDDIGHNLNGVLLDLYIAKYRDGKSKVKIQIDAEFEKIKMTEVNV
jgi:archaellum biogenesis ATPase FlaH